MLVIRKSMLKSFKYCPYRYFLEYVKGIHPPPSYEAEVGTIFHEWARRFHEYWRTRLEEEHGVLSRIQLQHFKAMIPPDVTGELRQMLEWFVEKEYEFLRNLRGFGLERYWLPVLTEYKFSVEIRDPVYVEPFIAEGTIDRVDESPNGYILVEYKTSRSANFTSYRLELNFYRMALERLGYNVILMRVINPLLGKIWDFKRSFVSESSMRKIINELIMSQKMGTYRPKLGRCTWCPVKVYCKYMLKGIEGEI